MRRVIILLVLTFSFAVFDSAEAQNVNIDFGSAAGAPSNAFGAASGQVGVWNTLGLGTTSSLLDITGVATTASATVNAAVDTGFAGITCGGDIGTLVDDNFYTSGAAWSVDIGGLTNGTYSVYLYGPSHTGVETGNMIVNGIPVSSISGDGCSFVAGTNYTTVQVPVTNGTLSVAGTNVASYAGLSGLQLIQQETPSIPGVGNSIVFPPFPPVCGVPGNSLLCQTGGVALQ